MLQSKSEIQQVLFLVEHIIIEQLCERFVKFIDEIVDGLPGEQKILDLFHFSPESVFILIEGENILISGFVEYLEAMICDVIFVTVPACLINHHELLKHIIDNLVKLSPILHYLVHLAVYLTHLSRLQDILQHSYVTVELLYQLLHLRNLLLPCCTFEVQSLNELLKDGFVHAALKHLQQPLQVYLILLQLFKLGLILMLVHVVIQHELQLLDLYYVILNLLTFVVLVSNLVSYLHVQLLFEVMVQLAKNLPLYLQRLFTLLHLLLPQVLEIVEKIYLQFLVRLSQCEQRGLLLWIIFFLEISLILFLLGFVESGDGLADINKGILNEVIRLSDSLLQLFFHFFDVELGGLSLLDVIVLEVLQRGQSDGYMVLIFSGSLYEGLNPVFIPDQLVHEEIGLLNLFGLASQLLQESYLLALLSSQVLSHYLVLADSHYMLQRPYLQEYLPYSLLQLIRITAEIIIVRKLVLKVADQLFLLHRHLAFYISVVISENMAQEETLENISYYVVRKGNIGLKGIGNHFVVLFLTPCDMEDEPIEDTVRLDQKGLQFQKKILAVSQEIDTLQRELVIVAPIQLLIELNHIGLEPLHDLQQWLKMLDVIFLLGQFLTIKAVDVDGGVHLNIVHCVVVLAHYFHVGQIVLESTLQKDQDILFVVDQLAFLFYRLLLLSQLLYSISDLIPHFRKILSYLFIVLHDQQVLVDGFKELLPELLDLLCVNDVLLEELFGESDEQFVPVVCEVFTQGAFEYLEVNLFGDVALERGYFQLDGIVLAEILQDIVLEHLLCEHRF